VFIVSHPFSLSITKPEPASDSWQNLDQSKKTASVEELAGAYHFAPGGESVAEVDKKLRKRGWRPSPQEKPPLLGLDGKWQLDLYDPDGTRAEVMEFLPVKAPCCSK